MFKQYPLKDVSDDVLAKIGQGVLNTYHIDNLCDIDRKNALSNEIKDLLKFNEGNDSESLAKVRTRRQLPNSITDEMLMPTIFEFENGFLLLASVWRNEADETLIEIFSDQVLDLVLLKTVVPILNQAFSWALAKYISVWTKPDTQAEKQLFELSGSIGCDSFLAANQKQLVLTSNSELTLRAFDLEIDWPWYEKEYTHFLTQNPKMKDIVPISSKDEVQEAISDSLCVCALKDGNVIGMIMAEESSELGYNGLMFTDIFIGEHYRGQGYASPMQRLFIKEHFNKYQFFCGFINKENLPSLNNAIKQGRQRLRQEICIPVHHFI